MCSMPWTNRRGVANPCSSQTTVDVLHHEGSLWLPKHGLDSTGRTLAVDLSLVLPPPSDDMSFPH